MRRDDALAILKAHAPELRELGVVHLSLYGSTARDEARDDSDVDIAVRLEEIASGFASLGRLDLIKRRLGELLQARVDVVPEPSHTGPLKTAIERESYLVF
jgi:predicted nucleotidyltransferase